MRVLTAAAAIGLCTFVLLLGCTVLRQTYSGPVSDHFDGKRFFNQAGAPEPTFMNFLKWLTSRDKGPWQKTDDRHMRGQKPSDRVHDTLRVTFINHATFLIQTDGLNILTDPIWSDRASPFSFIGPQRMHQPGIAFDDLPRIDAVLISHNHYDHLDLRTLRKLCEKKNAKIFTPLGNKALLEKQGISQVTELDWWEQRLLADALQITCIPARHFSGRGMFDSYKTLWGGFVLESKAGAVYFAGDTGFGPHIKQIAEKFGNIRVALLPIGAFRPEWFMSYAHLSPNDALQAHKILAAETSIAMHFGTFPLADDSQNEPREYLSTAIAHTDMEGTEFMILDFGQCIDIAHPETTR